MASFYYCQHANCSTRVTEGVRYCTHHAELRRKHREKDKRR